MNQLSQRLRKGQETVSLEQKFYGEKYSPFLMFDSKKRFHGYWTWKWNGRLCENIASDLEETADFSQENKQPAEVVR